MRTKAIPHQFGWDVSYDFKGLCNTDGSVSIYKMDTKPTVTIEQIY